MNTQTLGAQRCTQWIGTALALYRARSATWAQIRIGQLSGFTGAVATELIDKQGVVALFLNRGTPHSEALRPLLTDRKVPLVGPSTGAMVLHQPVHPWVFNVRATCQREAARAVEHLFGLGINRIAVLQTDDAAWADAAQGATAGFDKVGQKPLWVEKFPRDKPDFTDLAIIDASGKFRR